MGRVTPAALLVVVVVGCGARTEIGPGPDDGGPGGHLLDPSGSEVSVDATWTVSRAPPTSAGCALARIDLVALGFIDEGAEAIVTLDALTFPCALGSFDTRPLRVLRRGRYRTVWVARDAEGVEVGRGRMDVIDLSADIDHVSFGGVDFVF